MSKNNQQETHEVRQLKALAGIMSCVLTHKVVATSADFKWTGPKLNDIWPEVLAFFRWTNDTMQSESQVRLFINSNTKEWKAWAFPQKARTGMSAHEITQDEEGYDRVQEQRARFSDTDGWTYWGTVHHHCNTSAFQSGADQQNEISQDGLHITVGSLNAQQWDIHARLYQSKCRLTSMKLTDFWDIGDALEGLPPRIKAMLPSTAPDEIARLQMGAPPTADQTFPEIWRTNVIDVRPVVVSRPVVQTTFGHNHHFHMRSLFCLRGKPNLDYDLRRARGDLENMIGSEACGLGDIRVVLDLLDQLAQVLDDDMLNILDICSHNDVLPGNLAEYISQQAAIEEMTKGKQESNGGDKGPATRQQILGIEEAHWQNEHGYPYGMGD